MPFEIDWRWCGDPCRRLVAEDRGKRATAFKHLTQLPAICESLVYHRKLVSGQAARQQVRHLFETKTLANSACVVTSASEQRVR